MKKLITPLLAASTLLVAAPALGHEGHSHSGLLAGFAHPFTGLDHLLAMLTVGLVAFRREQSILPLPAAFLLFMIVGAALGFSGIELPSVETGIAASVLGLGLMLTFAKQLPLTVGVILAGGFALFHGHAHAAEMAVGSIALLYIVGFVMGTAILHGAGFGLGVVADKVIQQRWLAPVAGLGTAGAGAAMLLGVI